MNSTLIRLIQFRAAYNLPVHVAVECGEFERLGLEVEVSYTPGSAYLSRALEAGEFEIGHTAADDVVSDVEGGKGAPALFLFMGLHSGLLSLVGSPNHPDLESLRGASLAVDARTNGFVLLLEKALRDRSFASDDYHLVEVGGFESRYQALRAGKCAATLLTPPFVDDAVAAGCHLLLRGHEMTPVYQATCGAARRAWARDNAETLVSYIRAYVAATRWCFDPKNRAGCLELLGKHSGVTGVSGKRVLDALLDPAHGLYPSAELNLRGIEAVLGLRAEMGHLATPLPPITRYLDRVYHERALATD